MSAARHDGRGLFKPLTLMGVVAALVGAVTVFRSEALPPVIDLNSTSAGLTVYGDDAGDRSGGSVAAGDINGDGTDDLIIGAFLANPADAGQTYVIYGGGSLPATIDLNSTSAGLTVYGDDANDWSGQSIAAGDIDGDGIDDLIIGAPAPLLTAEGGQTYVIYGGPGLPATIDLNSTSAGLTVYGDDAGDWSGRSVAAGDINGDGTHDLIIGALGADPAGGAHAGETYVIYGGPPATPTPTPTPIAATIDIKPGSFPNSINLSCHGVIPVAILTGETFDAAAVDPGTVTFAAAPPRHSGLEDVDGEGDIDMILHFRCQQVSIEPGAEEACLEGSTYDGLTFEACDSVRIVPPDSPADSDGDGFTDAAEICMGTDLLDACPDNADDDAWPPDMASTGGYGKHDGAVNILDIVQVTPPFFNTSPPDPNYSVRKDLNGDGAINILDVVRLMPPVFNQSCTP